jgi:hypothetical protein
MKRMLLLVGLAISMMSAIAQTSIPKAQSMFIYNFSRLIEWPEAYKSGDFVIGVLGTSDVFTELQAYTAGKKVGLQNIIVQKYKEVGEIDKCNILFISYGKSSSIAEIISKIGSGSTLIIAEKKGMAEAGAAINFLVSEDKLKFELKSLNATKNGLKLSSKMEEMASNSK